MRTSANLKAEKQINSSLLLQESISVIIQFYEKKSLIITIISHCTFRRKLTLFTQLVKTFNKLLTICDLNVRFWELFAQTYIPYDHIAVYSPILLIFAIPSDYQCIRGLSLSRMQEAGTFPLHLSSITKKCIGFLTSKCFQKNLFLVLW